MTRMRARLVDDAMAGIEGGNRALTGVLPNEYARPALDKTWLARLIDCVESGLVSCKGIS